eukprot:SAG11_NODE_927_length_6519_cov_2.357788_5_plen_880_part_00
MVAPFSMTSTRAALWALDNSSSSGGGGSRNSSSNASLSGASEACLFRAMINGWRDAQPTGDYSFIFAQSPHAASALAMSAALPYPSIGGGGGSGSGGFPDDRQVVDTTGVAVPDLLVDNAAGGGGKATLSLARRMALALVNVAFGTQPCSAFTGPLLTSAAIINDPKPSFSEPSRLPPAGRLSGISVELRFRSLAPGKLQLRGTPGCSVCCNNNGLDVRLASSADLRAESTTSIRASHVQMSSDGSKIIAGFLGPSLTDWSEAYKVAILVGGAECVLLGTASNISAVPVAVTINSTHSAVVAQPNRLETNSAIRRDVSSKGLFATPPLGWNAWDAFHCEVSERLVVAMADAMVASGMAAAGYTYINLDDCWATERSGGGLITADPARLPSGIKALVDHVHAKGLSFGIYEAPGPRTPQGRPGMHGHEEEDVATFCEWGVDYIKLDAKGSSRAGWGKVRAAINACPRPMYLQVAFCHSVHACETADGENWMEGLANAWRTGQDGQANWASVIKSLDHTEPLWPLAGPTGPVGGHWNDADMLESGNVGLSVVESRSMMALFAMLNVPLMVSNDLRKLLHPQSKATLALLTCPGLLAINQDKLGYPGRRLLAAPTPSPPPAQQDHAIGLGTCNGADAQNWKAVVHATDEASTEFLHRRSNYALTLPDPSCGDDGDVRVRTSAGDGVPLVLAYSNASNGCGGRNQRWLVKPNGVITSLLNGDCIDVSGGRTHPVVQSSEVCGTRNGTAPSETWKVESGPAQSVTIRWAGAPGFSDCVCAHCEHPSPIGGSGDYEILQKQLAGGDVALLLLNRNEEATPPLNITVDFTSIPGLNHTSCTGSGQTICKRRVVDVFTNEDQEIASDGLSRVVPAHGVAVLRLKPLE